MLFLTKQSGNHALHVAVESLRIKKVVRHARHVLLGKQVAVVTRAFLVSIVRVRMTRPQFVVTARKDIIKEIHNKLLAFRVSLVSTTIKQHSHAASYAQNTPFLVQRTGTQAATLALKVEHQLMAA